MEYDPKKVICSCARVTCGDIADAVKAGAATLEDVKERTRATAFCGSCTDRVQGFLDALLDGSAVAVPEKSGEISAAYLPPHCYRPVCEDIYMIGGSERRLQLFENLYPVPNGVSYNSYVLLDQKTVLLDSADQSISGLFLNNLEVVLGGRPLDYVVVNHMEPDHCATLGEVLRRYPKAQVICTAAAKKLIQQFFGPAMTDRVSEVRDGVSVMMGKHILSFHLAPMVHWPEVMVTYDRTSKTLFSADAFGSFGALDGNLFADELDFANGWMDEYRRYYTNIVGKYGVQVQALLKKAAGLEIERICPLHGPVWRRDLNLLLEKYQQWSTYTPEDRSVVIACGSIYGNTQLVCEVLASMLSELGVRNVRLYDVSKTHPSYILSEAFRCSALVFGSVTYNAGLFPAMETLLSELKAHDLKNRTVAIIENGSWAPMAGRKMREVLESMKNITILPESITLRSSMTQEQRPQLEALAKAIAASLK